jgi:hypothetical protein
VPSAKAIHPPGVSGHHRRDKATSFYYPRFPSYPPLQGLTDLLRNFFFVFADVVICKNYTTVPVFSPPSVKKRIPEGEIESKENKP